MKSLKNFALLCLFIGQSLISYALMTCKAGINAKLTISSSLIADSNNLQMEIYTLGIDDQRTNKIVTANTEGFNLVFTIDDIKQPTYFKITGLDKRLSECLFLLSPDDNIVIDNEADQIDFSGNNAVVYQCIYKQREISENFRNTHAAPAAFGESLFPHLKYNYILKRKQEALIKTYEGKISSTLLGILLADLHYGELASYYSLLKLKSVDKSRADKFLSNFQQPDTTFDNSLLISYPGYVINKLEYEQAKVNRKFEFQTASDYLMQNFRGRPRQQLIAFLYANNLKSKTISAQQFDQTLSYADDDFKSLYRVFTKGSIWGVPAPDFKLEGVDGKQYSLADFKGKILVMDFWFTGCGACKLVNPIIEQTASKTNQDKVAFLSISLDKSKEKWKNSLKGNEYCFPRAVKLYTEGLGRNHAMVKDYNVTGCPKIVIISPDGKILPLGVNPRVDNGQNLLAIIRSNEM